MRHYLQVTDNHFESAVCSDHISDQKVTAQSGTTVNKDEPPKVESGIKSRKQANSVVKRKGINGAGGTRTHNQRIMSLSTRNPNSQSDNDLHESQNDGCRNGCRSEFEIAADDDCDSVRIDEANRPKIASIDDPEFEVIIESWSKLSRPLKEAVIAICQTASGEA